jgi:TRAP-type C4-dicarboxylate transport system permease small subunit
MTPLSFEWQWNMDYGIFMGFLYLALTVVACGLILAFIKTLIHMHEEDQPESQTPEIPSRSKYSEY